MANFCYGLSGFDDDKDGYIRKPACSYEKLEPRKIRKKQMFWNLAMVSFCLNWDTSVICLRRSTSPVASCGEILNQNLSPRQILSGMVIKELLEGIPFLHVFDFTSLPGPEFAKKSTYRHWYLLV